MKSLFRLMQRGTQAFQRPWPQTSACQNFSKSHGLFLQSISPYSSSKQNIPNQHSANSLSPRTSASATAVNNENPPTLGTPPATSSPQRQLKYPFGASTFSELVAADIFVDKTSVIKKIIATRGACYLFCRPRRWGKSMLLSMLELYLRIEVNSDGSKKYELGTQNNLSKKRESKRIFYAKTNGGKNLKISQDTQQNKEMEKQHMGEWPVISLTMPEFGENESLQQMKNKIKKSICYTYQKHLYLVQAWMAQIKNNQNDSLYVKKMEKKIAKFNQIAQDQGKNASDSFIQKSLAYLSRLLHEHFGKKAIILIDQFDKPYYCSYSNSSRSEIYQYLSDIFGEGLKQNTNRDIIVATGISKVKGTGTLSPLNIFVSFTVDSSDGSFNECFGYSKQEIQVLTAKALYGVEKIQSSDKETFEAELKLLKDYCNGYWISKKELYNPWSINGLLKIMQYQKAQKLEYELTPVYPMTGNMTLIQKLFLKFCQDLDILELIKTYRYQGTIKPQIHWQEMDNKSALLHFLYFAGYLTKNKQWSINKASTHFYVVPNQEIRIDFFNQIVKLWMKNKMKFNLQDVQRVIQKCIQHLNQDDVLKSKITQILKLQFDLRNLTLKEGQKQTKLPEQTLRDFVHFFIQEGSFKLKKMGYQNYVDSQSFNEMGFKTDMNFIPIDKFSDTLFLHEYKTIPQNKEKQLQKALQGALWQMLSKGYFETIVNRSNLFSHIKKIKMSAIVASGEPSVWIESYTFEIGKAIEMAKNIGNFMKQSSNQKQKRKDLCDGDQKTRAQFFERFKCKNVREFLKQNVQK